MNTNPSDRLDRLESLAEIILSQVASKSVTLKSYVPATYGSWAFLKLQFRTQFGITSHPTATKAGKRLTENGSREQRSD